MEQSNGMSLKVLAIVLALFALLVGYLLGNWIIQLVTGGGSNTSQLLDPDNKVVEQEIILEDEDTEESISGNYFMSISEEQGNIDTYTPYSQDSQIRSNEVYVIQVGAFNSRINAEVLSQELSSKGFQTFIADESIPYKVQIGAFTDRDQAEEIEQEVEALGYDAFITH